MPDRILFVCENAEISGAETILLALLSSLDRSLYEPYAVCPSGGPMAQRLAGLGVPVERIAVPRLRRTVRSAVVELPRLRAFSRRLQTLLRDRRIDIVHSNSLGAHLACADAIEATGATAIWHMHDILKRRWINGLVLRRAARSADRIICVSCAVSRELEAWGIPAEKLVVIYNGLDIEGRFRPRPASGLLHAQFGLPPAARLVGMIGQLTPWKGQHVFLRAAATVAAEHADAVFLVVGSPLFRDDGYRRQLNRLTRELRIEGAVMFTGRRDDVPEVLAELDVVVHASVLPDPLPTVLLEAGACAKPTVATACGGVPEIVDDGRTGLVVPSNDAEAMAAAVDRLLSDRDAASAMGAAARRLVEKRFRIEPFAERIESLYRELLRSPAAAPEPGRPGGSGAGDRMPDVARPAPSDVERRDEERR
ncbi:MAG: glycosyltransferase family 4 protein [Armatimonadota bacterium]|nr:MAG: glycosyltransferase family 4 protein [Armatimonadota bacterium]